MEAADKQAWTLEWFHSGFAYADLAILARGYPTTQSKHYFGLSPNPPIVEPEVVTPPAVPYANQVDPLTWYWGPGVGTSTARVVGPVAWLLRGIPRCGPEPHAPDLQARSLLVSADGRRVGRPARCSALRVRECARAVACRTQLRKAQLAFTMRTQSILEMLNRSLAATAGSSATIARMVCSLRLRTRAESLAA